MSEALTIPTGSPRERIMQVAADLFYRQGYRATGINEVIERSGVAKATFYKHFPSKEELGRAYIDSMREAEEQYLAQSVAQAKTPRERLLSVIGSLAPWLQKTHFRGCPFINMASEIPDPDNPLRGPGKTIYTSARATVRTLAEELIASDPERYRRMETEKLTNDYMLLYVGAVALAEIYQNLWPVEHALEAARRLIDKR
jgi:AcrR family transcriptional regulator